jgi:hypothetical protein
MSNPYKYSEDYQMIPEDPWLNFEPLDLHHSYKSFLSRIMKKIDQHKPQGLAEFRGRCKKRYPRIVSVDDIDRLVVNNTIFFNNAKELWNWSVGASQPVQPILVYYSCNNSTRFSSILF